MKKIIFFFSVLATLSLSAHATYCPSNTSDNLKGRHINKENEISIGTNRASGEMLLRFKSNQEGKASITVLNALGEIVMEQTEQVTNSLNTITLKNATQLKEGSYTVRLILKKDTYHTSFMIWK